MEVVKKIARYISWIVMVGIGCFAYYKMEHGAGDMERLYKALFTGSILFIIGFVWICIHVENSGKSRLIPEIVYFLGLAVYYRILDQNFEDSLMRKTIYGILIVAGLARIVLFILNSKEYHSAQAVSERIKAGADYDYEKAKFEYEYELKHGRKYSDMEAARVKYEDAKKRQRRIHQNDR